MLDIFYSIFAALSILYTKIIPLVKALNIAKNRRKNAKDKLHERHIAQISLFLRHKTKSRKFLTILQTLFAFTPLAATFGFTYCLF